MVTAAKRTLVSVTDPVWGTVYAVSALEQELQMPWKRRNLITTFGESSGGRDPRGGMADPTDIRTVSAKITVVYDSGTPHFTAAWDSFVRLVQVGEVILKFKESDGSFWLARGKCIEADMAAAAEYEMACEIPATFSLPDPFLYAPSSVLEADTGLKADTGLHADQGAISAAVVGQTTTLSCTNVGTVPDMQARIRLAGGGSAGLTGPIVVINYAAVDPNTLGGRRFTYSATIPPGETITVDNGTGDVTGVAAGAAAYANFYPDYLGECYLPIVPGLNVIDVVTGSATGQGGLVTLEFLPRKV